MYATNYFSNFANRLILPLTLAIVLNCNTTGSIRREILEADPGISSRLHINESFYLVSKSEPTKIEVIFRLLDDGKAAGFDKFCSAQAEWVPAEFWVNGTMSEGAGWNKPGQAVTIFCENDSKFREFITINLQTPDNENEFFPSQPWLILSQASAGTIHYYYAHSQSEAEKIVQVYAAKSKEIEISARTRRKNFLAALPKKLAAGKFGGGYKSLKWGKLKEEISEEESKNLKLEFHEDILWQVNIEVTDNLEDVSNALRAKFGAPTKQTAKTERDMNKNGDMFVCEHKRLEWSDGYTQVLLESRVGNFIRTAGIGDACGWIGEKWSGVNLAYTSIPIEKVIKKRKRADADSSLGKKY